MKPVVTRYSDYPERAAAVASLRAAATLDSLRREPELWGSHRGVPGGDDPVVYSVYLELSSNPHISLNRQHGKLHLTAHGWTFQSYGGLDAPCTAEVVRSLRGQP